MIKEEYVSFEVAKLLKEKGFNEPVYNSIRKMYKDERNNAYSWRCDVKENFNDIPEDRNYQMVYSCPTQQMAMRWLREVHHLFFNIRYFHLEEGSEWMYIDICKPRKIGCEMSFEGFSYEDLIEQSIKYCLENLL